MLSVNRILFAEKIVKSLNEITQGGWVLTQNVKGNRDFITILVTFKKNGVQKDFYLMVGAIHASPGDSADLLFDHGNYTDQVTVVRELDYNEDWIASDIKMFLEGKAA